MGTREVELRHLRYAVAVADCGSFTRAAALLGIETSALSRRVRDLEASLGIALFKRLPRGTRPTPAGIEYLEEAREILARIDRAEQRALRAAASQGGELSIGYVWSFARGFAAELLALFHAEHPQILLHLAEDGPEPLMRRMHRGDLDLVLTATAHANRPVIGAIEHTRQVPLWSESIHAIVPLTERREVLEWADLAEHDILYRRGDAASAFNRHVEEMGGPRLRFVPQDCSHSALPSFVSAGLGWALAPESMASSDLTGVRVVPVRSAGAALQVVAVWQSEGENPALARFVALARRLYGSHPIS